MLLNLKQTIYEGNWTNLHWKHQPETHSYYILVIPRMEKTPLTPSLCASHAWVPLLGWWGGSGTCSGAQQAEGRSRAGGREQTPQETGAPAESGGPTGWSAPSSSRETDTAAAWRARLQQPQCWKVCDLLDSTEFTSWTCCNECEDGVTSVTMRKKCKLLLKPKGNSLLQYQVALTLKYWKPFCRKLLMSHFVMCEHKAKNHELIKRQVGVTDWNWKCFFLKKKETKRWC